ncbi:hypothetical protein D3C74_201020 [compost metagenome]
MAKVIKSFKERYHNYKKYETGDEYPDENKERISYLADKGFLEIEVNKESDKSIEEPKTRQRKKKDVGNDVDPDA